MLIKGTTFAILLVLATGAAAQSGDEDQTPAAEQVTYGDLNLNSPANQAILRHRIQAAAGRVCDVGGMQSMQDFIVYSHCYSAAYMDGIRQMNRVVAARSAGTAVAASALVIARK